MSRTLYLSFLKYIKRVIRVKHFHTLNYRCRKSSIIDMNVESVHKTAEEGFKQGDHYDRSRPSYADELVSRVIESLHSGNHQDVKYDILELGAGTGKFTRRVLELLKDKPVKYLATEPSEEFLSVLKQQSPDVETLVCSAIKIPLPEQSVQNVICAQCFHWFATEENLNEIQRVLVPGGRLIWNDKDSEIEWQKKMEDILKLYYFNTPRKISGEWKNVFENCKSFRCVESSKFAGIIGLKGDKDFVLNHYTSISVIARLDPQQKEQAIKKYRDVLDETFGDDEEINIMFNSEFYCTEKVAN